MFFETNLKGNLCFFPKLMDVTYYLQHFLITTPRWVICKEFIPLLLYLPARHPSQFSFCKIYASTALSHVIRILLLRRKWTLTLNCWRKFESLNHHYKNSQSSRSSRSFDRLRRTWTPTPALEQTLSLSAFIPPQLLSLINPFENYAASSETPNWTSLAGYWSSSLLSKVQIHASSTFSSKA